MPWLSLLFKGISDSGSFLTSLMGNLFNWFATEKTNENNLQMVRETNQSNVEQANLAYQRSLPTNQVRNLMAAGMSRQGALSSLTGGGTYTAPVLQAGHSDAPQVDFSQFASALERLSDTPTNVEQYKLIQEQRHALEVDTQNKINADRREQEAHTYTMWQQQHGKEYASALDEASKTLVNSMLDAGTSYSDYKDAHDAVRKLGLSNKSLFRNMPALAWADLETAVRDANTERRANVAANDAHDLAVLRKQIERINVKYYDKEKHEQLLNLMRVGEGLIQDNNLKFADLTAQNMENYVREAGIHDEAQAQALAAYVERLANDDEALQQMFIHDVERSAPHVGLGRRGVRQVLRDFGEILRSMHFSAGKYSVNKRTRVSRE